MRSTGRLLPLLFVTFALGAAHADTLTIPSHGAISGSPDKLSGTGSRSITPARIMRYSTIPISRSRLASRHRTPTFWQTTS